MKIKSKKEEPNDFFRTISFNSKVSRGTERPRFVNFSITQLCLSKKNRKLLTPNEYKLVLFQVWHSAYVVRLLAHCRFKCTEVKVLRCIFIFAQIYFEVRSVL